MVLNAYQWKTKIGKPNTFMKMFQNNNNNNNNNNKRINLLCRYLTSRTQKCEISLVFNFAVKFSTGKR